MTAGRRRTSMDLWNRGDNFQYAALVHHLKEWTRKRPLLSLPHPQLPGPLSPPILVVMCMFTYPSPPHSLWPRILPLPPPLLIIIHRRGGCPHLLTYHYSFTIWVIMFVSVGRAMWLWGFFYKWSLLSELCTPSVIIMIYEVSRIPNDLGIRSEAAWVCVGAAHQPTPTQTPASATGLGGMRGFV